VGHVPVFFTVNGVKFVRCADVSSRKEAANKVMLAKTHGELQPEFKAMVDQNWIGENIMSDIGLE
jgi:hypothetical protein